MNKMGSGKALTGCARQCDIKRTTHNDTNIASWLQTVSNKTFRSFLARF